METYTMAEKVIKTKSVNAYVDKYGHKFVVILLENGNKTFINEGLLAYACQNAKQVKEKANE